MSALNTARVGEFCKIGAGGTPSRDKMNRYYVGGTIPWVKSGELREAIINTTEEHVTEAALKETNVKLVPVGALLLAMYGATVGRLGVLGVAATTNQAVCHIIPDPKIADVRYVFHALRSQVASLVARGVGGAQPNISQGIVKELAVPLPSLAEQRRTADVLDRTEALRAKRRAALAQLDTLTQSIFLDLFGDPATNPKAWPCCAFGVLGENEDSQRIPVKSSDRDARKGQYPYYGASGIIDWVDEYIFDGERLLIGEDGANLVARATPVAYIARGRYWVNNHAHVVAENGRADLRFLEYFIERLDLKPFISGTAQPKLNRSNLDRIPVPLPPLVMQRNFACSVAALEKLKSIHRSSLAEMDALFAVLQYRAFRGDL